MLHVYTMDTCSVVISRQSHSPILQFNSPCNEFMSVWSMFVYKCLVYVCLQVFGQCLYTSVWSMFVYKCLVNVCIQASGQCLYTSVWSMFVYKCLVNVCIQVSGQCLYTSLHVEQSKHNLSNLLYEDPGNKSPRKQMAINERDSTLPNRVWERTQWIDKSVLKPRTHLLL